MDKKICLDTNVIISLIRDKNLELIEKIDAKFYTTSISVFELWFGRRKSENLPQLFDVLEIVDLDEESAKIAANIMLELKKEGKMINLNDLFIAAICIRNNLKLLTVNKKDFKNLEKFNLVLA